MTDPIGPLEMRDPSSLANPRAGYQDPEYAPLIELRRGGSDLDFVRVGGL